MIVNYKEEGWEVISQRAHGLLAAAIANEWLHKIRSHRWVETLIAIAEHDDAQVELNQPGLLTHQGGPVDFSMRKMEFDHCEQTLIRSYNKSTYIALLCGYHMEFLCKGDGSESKEIGELIKREKGVRNNLLKALGIEAKDLERDYRLLEWCDALSLLLCKALSQPEEREMDISEGPDGRMYKLALKESGNYTVKPWPFQQNSFELYCEARILNQLHFNSDDEFKAEFEKSIPFYKTWEFER